MVAFRPFHAIQTDPRDGAFPRLLDTVRPGGARMKTMESNEARVAIVTGGSRGIGRAVAEAFLGEGWRVHLCGRTPEHVETARRELAGRFGDAVAAEVLDSRRQEEVDRFVTGVLEREGRIDCLVNNAGVGTFAPVDELSGEQWRELIETNLSGYF